MTGAKTFLRHTAVFGIGAMLIQAVNVVLLPVYLRYLSPSEFGILEILQRSGEVIVLMLMVNGIRGAAFTFCCQAKTTQEQSRTASTIMLVIWVGCLIGTALVFIAAPFLNSALAINDYWLTVVGLMAAISQLLPALPMALMQVRLESIGFMTASLIATVLRLCLIIVGVVYLEWSIWGVLYGTILSSTVMGSALSFREISRFGFKPDLNQLRPIVKFAIPFIPNGFLGFGLICGDRFFLLWFAGSATLGIYSAALRLAGAVQTVSMQPLFQVWSSWMYQVYERDDAAIEVGKSITRIFAAYVFVGFSFFVVRNEVIMLASPAYLASASLLGLLIVAQGFKVLSSLFDGPFYVFRRSELKAWITTAATVVGMVAYATLIPLFKEWGAAVALLIAFSSYSAFTFVVAQRIFPIKYEFKRIGAMVVLAVLLGLPTYWMGVTVLGFSIKIILICLWPLLLFFAGFLHDDEKDNLKRYAKEISSRASKFFVGKKTEHN